MVTEQGVALVVVTEQGVALVVVTEQGVALVVVAEQGSYAVQSVRVPKCKEPLSVRELIIASMTRNQPVSAYCAFTKVFYP